MASDARRALLLAANSLSDAVFRHPMSRASCRICRGSLSACRKRSTLLVGGHLDFARAAHNFVVDAKPILEVAFSAKDLPPFAGSKLRLPILTLGLTN